MLVVNGVDTEQHEDDCLRAAAQHFHGVLDGRVGFGWYVGLHIILHGEAAEHDGQNARHVEYFSIEVGQVAHDENKDGLDDAHVIREPSHKPSQEAPNDADERPTQRHHQKRRESRQDVLVPDILWTQLHVSIEHIVQHDSNGVIEKRFAEHDDVEYLVDVNLLENCENGDGIHGRDERREQERVQNWHLHTVRPCQSNTPQRQSNGDGVPDRAQNRKQDDGAEMIEKSTVGHEIASIENDRWQQEQEERGRRQR